MEPKLPEWVLDFVAWAESWTVVLSMGLMIFIPIVLAFGLVWMVRGFWRMWKSDKGG